MIVGSETQPQPYRLGEYHAFSASGTEFLYLIRVAPFLRWKGSRNS